MEENYVDILKTIYNNRKKKNPAYSISKFSKDAGFKSYHMSDVFSGRYGLSLKRAVLVAENLQMSETVKRKFLRLVKDASAKSKEDKSQVEYNKNQLTYTSDRHMSLDEFHLLSDWYYFALIELIRKLPKEYNPYMLYEKLDISKEQCQIAIDTLLKLNYLKQENNFIEVNHELISVTNDTPSEDIRRYHRTMIAKSLQKMETLPIEKRFFSSFNLNLSCENYKDFHEELSAFIRKKILSYQKDSTDAQLLHTFNFQLFPLEKDGSDV